MAELESDSHPRNAPLGHANHPAGLMPDGDCHPADCAQFDILVRAQQKPRRAEIHQVAGEAHATPLKAHGNGCRSPEPFCPSARHVLFQSGWRGADLSPAAGPLVARPTAPHPQAAFPSVAAGWAPPSSGPGRAQPSRGVFRTLRGARLPRKWVEKKRTTFPRQRSLGILEEEQRPGAVHARPSTLNRFAAGFI